MTAPVVSFNEDNLPNVPRILSPDEFEQAQMLTTKGLRGAKFPPMAPPLAALGIQREAADAARTQADAPPPQPQGLMARAFNALVGIVEHPVETAAGMVTAPIKGAFDAGRYIGQPIARAVEPDAVAAYRASGGHEVTGREAAIGAAQAAVPVVAGPATRVLSQALAPIAGEGAASFLATTAVGAGAGAVYAPEDPAVGAILGGGLGATAHVVSAAARAPEGAASLAGLRQRAADVLDPARAERLRQLETEHRAAVRAAEMDALTGVANRVALDRALPTAEADAATAVVAFDANNFGQVNKQLGHEAGDAMIRDMAGAIRQAAEEHGVGERVFRRGGDEFVVLAPADVADAVRTRAEQLFGARQAGDVEVSLTGNVGNTFANADAGLQAAKQARKTQGTATTAAAQATVSQYRPPAEADVLAMSPDEVKAASGTARDYERSATVDVFGPEVAKEYERAQRIVNAPYADFDTPEYKAAEKRIDDLESNLTPEQQHRLFGVGETGLNADELRDLAKQASAYDPEVLASRTTDELLQSAGRLLGGERSATDLGLRYGASRVIGELVQRGVPDEQIVMAAMENLRQKGVPSETSSEFLVSQIQQLRNVATKSAPTAGEPSPRAALPAGNTGPQELPPKTPVPPANEPPAVAAVREHMARVTDAWRTILAPATRSPEAAQAGNILRATTGEMAASYEQAAFKLDEFRRAIEPLSREDKLGFIDAIEGGRSQPTPIMADAAATIRATLDAAREQIRALGTGKLEHFIDDYFPHIWKDPERAGDAFRVAQAQAGSKRPMEGSKSFLKERTIPTTAEGVALGLEPVSLNPVDLTLLKLREMQRYIMAHQSLTEMKDAGLVKFVSAGELRPEGYARINDKIGTVFGPREGAVTLPEGANIAPEQVGVSGMRIMGEYWAPEPVAKVVNNYLSPGLRGNALYDAYRGLGNGLNQAQLGLSAFHLMFTSMDASVSRAALGLEYLTTGQPLKGLQEMISAPLAPVTNMKLGAKVRAAYLNPEGASPDMLALANAVQEAGGRVRMDSFYKNSAPERMIAAWKDGAYGKATALSIPSLLELASKPIMEHIVPLQKLGVFGDLAKKVLADLPPEATLAERRAALGRAWDSVDNRMGQLVYDNLFWSKTFKDLAMASVRSVGWNIGTIRELGGGITDIAKAGAKRATGSPAELTHRAAYVAALPVVVGLYGALYQYLRTGDGPQELKDYFFPKTGEVDADGNPERVQIASYMKDVFAYAGHPWETLKHKMNPSLSVVYEMLQNQDYYGDQIRNPNDPAMKQLMQEASFVAQQALPFSIRNMTEGSQRGDSSPVTKFGNWFGITPAPRDKVRSKAQNQMAEYLSERQMSGATPEDAAARRSRAEILAGLRGNSGVDLEKAVTDALERHQLTAPDLARLLKRAGTTPAQERFKRLTVAQAVDVFKLATPKEKALFAEALISKIERMASR